MHDILQRPLFHKAEAIATEEALARKVRWVHIMEVTQVGHLLNGNELILSTGIGWQDNEETSLSFLQQLIDSGASGLCIELGTYTKQPLESMKTLALQANFPLIFFHEEVRYIDITQDLHTHFIHQHELMRTAYIEENTRYQQAHWITDWLGGKHSLQDIYDYARNVKPAIKLGPVIVCAFDKTARSYGFHSQETLLFQKQMIARSLFEKEGFYLLATVYEQRIVFILIDQLPSNTCHERILRTIQRLQNTQETNLFPALLGIGKAVSDPLQIHVSYESAVETLEIQKDIGKLAKPFYHELHVYKVILLMKQSGQLTAFIDEYLGDILTYDREKNSQLLKTLHVYLTLCGSKQETAKELFIVRQTLYHRLDKIAAILGEDFMLPQKRIALELALHGYEYLNGAIP